MSARERDNRSRRRFLMVSSMLGLAAAFRPGTTGEGQSTHIPQLRSGQVSVCATDLSGSRTPDANRTSRGQYPHVRLFD